MINWFKKSHRLTKFGITQIILILLVLLLIVISISINHPINYLKATHDERVSNSIRDEVIGDLNRDREAKSQNQMVTSNRIQKVANKEAIKEYRIVAKKAPQSKYSMHELSTNSYHPKTSTGRKLAKHSDIHYGENCAEISFGKRTFRNPNHQFQPFKNVRGSWQMANLINDHFMKYDQASDNRHRNNITNPNNETMGISVIYNHKINRGILVEEFARHHK